MDLVQSILLSLYYLVASAYIGQALFGFTLAYMMLHCTVSVRKVVGSIVIVCWLVPEIIAAWMWFAMLSDGGTLQQALHAVGLPYQTWLISHPMISVSLANSWRGVAFSFLLFSAAFSDVPLDLLDAAMVDGARPWRRLRSIILPLLSTTILVDFVLITLGTLNDFTLIFAMTGGGPGTSSNVLSVFMYQQAFGTFQLAYGTAIAVVLLVIGAVLLDHLHPDLAQARCPELHEIAVVSSLPTERKLPSLAMVVVGAIFLLPFVWLVVVAFQRTVPSSSAEAEGSRSRTSHICSRAATTFLSAFGNSLYLAVGTHRYWPP